MSNWRTITIIICAVISVTALTIYFLALGPAQLRPVQAAKYATNTDLAYYIRSSAYTFYLSADKQTLEVKDAAGTSINLKLGGNVRSDGLKINSWESQPSGAILPPVDCGYIQIRTYPGLVHKDLSTAISALDCKQNIDSEVLQSIETQ